MTSNPHLHDALEIFHQLGWADASPEHALDLPLGSPEQQQRDLAGLQTGGFGECSEYPDGSFGWLSYVGGHEFMLGLFAIRLGVSPHRALALLFSGELGVAVDVLASRGGDFVLQFVTAATKSHVKDPLVVLGLVERFQLPVPENRWYAKAWVNHYEQATDRFFAHLDVALAHSTHFNPGAFAPIVKEHSPLLPVLYPLITDPLNHTTMTNIQPWVNKLLDVLIHHANVLLAATRRGHIDPAEWGGLGQLAATTKTTTARTKARQLRELYAGAESGRR